MDPLVIGSAVAGIASYAHKTFLDKKRYQQQLNDQRANWRMQNAYNSSAQQMARLKSAGLNPNLVYQQGGALSSAGEISSPSYPDAPMFDSQGLAQMEIMSRQASADIEAKAAQSEYYKELARDVRGNNDALDKTTIKGFSKLENYQLIDNEAKNFYAGLFGMSPEQVDLQSMRWFKYANDIKSVAANNSNARKMLDILDKEKDIRFQEAERAFIVTALDNLNLHTEASKRGVKFQSSYDYNKELDLVFQSFLRQYKELKYQSSDFKHIFDATMDGISTIGNVIPKYHKGMFSDKYSKSKFR